MISFGSVSLIALVSFLLGKAWVATEVVQRTRQASYANFIKAAAHVGEFNSPSGKKVKIVDQQIELKEVSAELMLYCSPAVSKLVGEYSYQIGYLISFEDFDGDTKEVDGYEDMLERAKVTYEQMILAMRKDCLGISIYGIREKFWPAEHRGVL